MAATNVDLPGDRWIWRRARDTSLASREGAATALGRKAPISSTKVGDRLVMLRAQSTYFWRNSANCESVRDRGTECTEAEMVRRVMSGRGSAW